MILVVGASQHTGFTQSDLDNELADDGNLRKEAEHGSHVQTAVARWDKAIRHRLLGLVVAFVRNQGLEARIRD
jgi:hypothetical protein